MWSLLRWIYVNNRMRLGTENARKLLFIACTKRLRRGLPAWESDGDILLKAMLKAEESSG